MNARETVVLSAVMIYLAILTGLTLRTVITAAVHR
jgi:hypothetical protein